ncbi:MAG TPA: acetylxylan esterase, partial [Pirellulales bacterium]|nr:acetylxylan esterase [Pirellulales bacterium]
MRNFSVRASILLLLVSTPVRGDEQSALDMAALRRKVEALGNLTSAPTVHAIDTASSDSSTPRRIYFEGLPYRGRPTRVFAWYGLPKSRSRYVPGVVLAHGGGGTAYREWVEKWNAHGFAAIAPALEGQTDEHVDDTKQWKRHEWAGPARDGIYADSDEPIEDQWMYHAVADVVLAHALLQANENIDFDNIGLMGISWGGIVTATAVGIDTRFAFAVPTYGCGYLSRIDNQYGRALADNRVYLDVWEPGLRLNRAKMPMLWLTWLHDKHFPLDAQQASYRAAKGRRMVAVLPEMGHSHPAGWDPEDSYAFAKSVVATGKPWLREISQRRDGIHVGVDFV